MTIEFKKKILDSKKIPPDSVLAELKQMFQNFEEESSETFFDPIILKSALPEPFKSSVEQQDALEFGRIFLEIIENILKENKIKVLFFNIIN